MAKSSKVTKPTRGEIPLSLFVNLEHKLNMSISNIFKALIYS